MVAHYVPLSVMGASFLEQLLDGGGNRSRGVNLPHGRRRVLVHVAAGF
jgi:hypothetical protein